MTNDEFARRRRQLASEIARLGPCLPGSLTARTTACRSAGCHCRQDETRRHGPYLLWTRKVAGKTVTRTLSEEQAARYRTWLENKRHLDELVAELQQLSVAEMAANENWLEPDPPPPDRRRHS